MFIVQRFAIVFLIAFTILCSSLGYCQKLKSEVINYSFNRLPALPVKGINNYQVTFVAAYEAKNQQMLKEYQEQKQAAYIKYQKEMAAYAGLVKAADTRYEKELAEYNKKSLGSKIVETGLLNNRKPVREQISRPYLEEITKPVLQSSYDYSVMASTYINLEGYHNEPSNALKIAVILYGYDHTQPRMVSEETNNMRLGGGSASTYKAISYHTEFSYRHPMAVKVYTPDGKEMLNLTPPELNSYKIYKGPNTDRPTISNPELLIKTYEEKVLQDNLRFINNLLNDKYGFASIKRTANLYYIKNADSQYTDLTTAFNEASSGLLMLQQDNNMAKVKLQKACELWSTALKETDLNNKKARINKDITMGIYFDLLEGYYALGNVDGGQNTLDKLNTQSLTYAERKAKLDFDVLFSELKSRQLQN